MIYYANRIIIIQQDAKCASFLIPFRVFALAYVAERTTTMDGDTPQTGEELERTGQNGDAPEPEAPAADEAVENPAADFPIVGVGASAGGLKALQQFFQHMPDDSGMAFVVILHLSPTYESNVASLLQHFTAMPVVQVTEAVPVAPNRIYVIPPTKHLTMVDGMVSLQEPGVSHERRAPIDLFFRTLADTHGRSAGGVVLSGSGADGANGLKRIKEHGGVALAQDPDEAEYPDMPRSAIATGLVDYVLPVAALPNALVEYWRGVESLQLPRDSIPALDDHEELITVNQETKHKVEELSQTNNDLQNLMASTEIGTIFVDRELRIKFYTPSVQMLFNLIPSDLNRPLAHITHTLEYDKLPQDAARVLETLAVITREIRSTSGRWYLAGLVPYRTVKDKIDGVTLTFVDITERKRSEDALHESELRLPEILQQLRAAVLIAEPGGKVVLGNARAEAMFAGTQNLEDSRLWQPFTSAGKPYTRDQAPLARTLQKGEVVSGEELHLVREDGTSRILSVNAAPIRNQQGQIVAAVAAYEDITAQRQAEEALQQARDELARHGAK